MNSAGVPDLRLYSNDAYKRPWERKQKVSRSGHSSPDLGSLSSSQQHLGFTASSPIRQLPGRSLERISILERHLQRSFDATPLLPTLNSLLIFKHARLEPRGRFCVVQFPFFLWIVPALWNPWNTSITKITMCWVLSGWQDCLPFYLSWVVFVYLGNVLFLNIQTSSTSTEIAPLKIGG